MQADAETSEPVADVERPEEDTPGQRTIAAERRSTRRPPGPQDDEGWLENWQRNEIRWLRGEVEKLEQRLWWRTVILGSVSALSVLVASVLGLIALQDPEPPLLAQSDNPPRTLSARAPSDMAPPGRPSGEAGRVFAAALPESEAAADQDLAQPQAGQPERSLQGMSPEQTAAALQQAPYAQAKEEAAEIGQLVNTAGGADAEALRAAVVATETYIKQLESIAGQEVRLFEPDIGPADTQPEAQAPSEANTQALGVPSDLPAAPTAGAVETEREAGETAQQQRPAAPPVVVRPQAALGASPDGTADDEPPVENASALYTATLPVNLRAEPGTDTKVLTVLAEGDVVREIDRQGSWLRVRLIRSQAGDLTGYVHSRYLRPVAAPS